MSDRGERIDATEEYQLAMVEVARRSDVGRRRTHNEDRDLVAPPVLAVADGLGGQRAGEVAASIAVDALARVVANPTPTALRAAAEEANRTIRRVAGRSPERAGMGTTLTALLLTEGRVVVAHVGDSRAYL
ncbi:MAG: protein phosphatase 2C domain-containing protein [Actinobacteria bacterium]|nr:protein phosphatase 2C domain-containing protein [Actinomycetota bacterium]